MNTQGDFYTSIETRSTLFVGWRSALVTGLVIFPLISAFVILLSVVFEHTFGQASTRVTSSLLISGYLLMFSFGLPAIGLVAFKGSDKRKQANHPTQKSDFILSASLGGMVVMLVIGMLLAGNSQPEEFAAGQNTRNSWSGRVASPPTLKGTFQELTTVSGFEALAVSSDGKLLAVAANHQISIRDLEQNTVVGNDLTGHSDAITCLEFSPDSRWLLSGSLDRKVIVWSHQDGKIVYQLEGHQVGVTSLAISPDGLFAASVDNDGAIILWELTNSQGYANLTSGVESLPDIKTIHDLEFSSDGKLLASSQSENGVALFDVDQQKTIGFLNTPGEMSGDVYGVSFSPDGKFILGAAQNGPVVWDVQTRKPLGAVSQHATDLLVDYSPDGRWFAFTNQSAIYIYQAKDLKPVGMYPTPFANYVLFLPNGHLLAWYVDQGGSTHIGTWTLNLL